MKKALILVLLFLSATTGFSQMNKMQKFEARSKRDKVGGIIFLSAGIAFTVAGAVVLADGLHHQRYYNENSYNDLTLNSGTSEIAVGVFGLAGGAAFLGTSIPFFIHAHRYKMKAMQLGLKTESVPMTYRSSLGNRVFPALAVRMNIN